MKKIRIVRLYEPNKPTLGIFIILTNINGRYMPEFKCYSLELPWRDNQQGISCIPEGSYALDFEYSPKFNRHLWELKNVPDRLEIKIHPANTVVELRGCIALGYSYSIDALGQIHLENSRAAVKAFQQHLDPRNSSYEIIISKL